MRGRPETGPGCRQGIGIAPRADVPTSGPSVTRWPQADLAESDGSPSAGACKPVAGPPSGRIQPNHRGVGWDGCESDVRVRVQRPSWNTVTTFVHASDPCHGDAR
jgi:hypothetical protein